MHCVGASSGEPGRPDIRFDSLANHHDLKQSHIILTGPEESINSQCHVSTNPIPELFGPKNDEQGLHLFEAM